MAMGCTLIGQCVFRSVGNSRRGENLNEKALAEDNGH